MRSAPWLCLYPLWELTALSSPGSVIGLGEGPRKGEKDNMEGDRTWERERRK